jgi:TolB-like protein
VFLALSSCASPGPQPQPLEFESLTRSSDGAPIAHSSSIQWRVVATGGTGELRYEFRTSKRSVEIIEQEGPSPIWDWIPRRPGTFRVMVTVTDGAGDRVSSGWSSAFVVLPPIARSALIAVLPVHNLSAGKAPLALSRRLLRLNLTQRGLTLVEDEALEIFMERYRVRNTGGLNSGVSQAIAEETGAKAFLVTSLESFRDTDPPKVSLLSRLVLSGEQPEIVWTDGVGLSGDAHPGLLELGLIDQPEILLENAVRCLAESLSTFLSDENATNRAAPQDVSHRCDSRAGVRVVSDEGKRKFRPRAYFRDPTLEATRRYRVAVIPFLNLSERRDAGKVVALHFVNQLFRSEILHVIEPRLVTEQLRKYRIIMQAGPSLANAEVLSSQTALGVDLVFSGTVFDYQDAFGTPKVDFSVKIIERTSLAVVWSSRSHGTGKDSVRVFGLGTVHTAHRLADAMARATVDLLAP